MPTEREKFMKWEDSLATLRSRYSALESIPEHEASKVAQQFFVQEIYPRFQCVLADLQKAGFDACLLPAAPSPEDSARRIETVAIRIFRRHESGREIPPIAAAEITYRLALLCDTVVHTRQGRMNQGVFILAGEPVKYIEEVIQSLKSNLSLGA